MANYAAADRQIDIKVPAESSVEAANICNGATRKLKRKIINRVHKSLRGWFYTVIRSVS